MGSPIRDLRLESSLGSRSGSRSRLLESNELVENLLLMDELRENIEEDMRVQKMSMKNLEVKYEISFVLNI